MLTDKTQKLYSHYISNVSIQNLQKRQTEDMVLQYFFTGRPKTKHAVGQLFILTLRMARTCCSNA